ncbi:unnamed protein product [Pedinophyceae sp. YPF-701]|nr:unnamed protein product [Pedinophyceae sp. YPF-701]
MSLRTAAARFAPAVRAQGLVPAAGRFMSIEKTYKDRESAAENVYFSHEEHEALRKLAAKLKEQAAAKESTKAVQVHAQEKHEAAQLLGKHGIKATDAALEDLVAWKHS